MIEDKNHLIDLISNFLINLIESNGEPDNNSDDNDDNDLHLNDWENDLTTATYNSLENPSTFQLFIAKSIPSISIKSYLQRILKYCPTCNQVYLSLIIYFDRLSSISKLFIITPFNVHRLIIAAITVSSKFFSDIFYTNQRYAKVGGLPLSELNQLELHFLLLLNFNLYINQSEFQSYSNKLLSIQA